MTDQSLRSPQPKPNIHEAHAALLAATTDEKIARYNTRMAALVARDVGVSWEAIGNALGISRQAAQQRYGEGPVGSRV